jgi:hypothetical protein
VTSNRVKPIQILVIFHIHLSHFQAIIPFTFFLNAMLIPAYVQLALFEEDALKPKNGIFKLLYLVNEILDSCSRIYRLFQLQCSKHSRFDGNS